MRRLIAQQLQVSGQNDFALLDHGTPSSHILKPAIHAVEDSVTNEGFCMALAEAMRLKPAKSEVHAVFDSVS